MSLTAELAEQRRLILLATLCEATDYELNENSLKMILDHQGHHVTQDVRRADLHWLEEQGLIRIEKLNGADGELWKAHLTGNGEDVANGARHPGVARPRAH